MKCVFRAILLWISFSGSLSQASTTFVGNGGDGFHIDGKVYLSDLVLGGEGLYKEPWIGKDASRVPLFFFNESLIKEPEFPIELLTRKLNDLERLWTGFGLIVGEAIRVHQWNFVSHTLGSTCDRSPRIIDINVENMESVQIANRYQGEVFIQKELWSKMSDEHKVALLIHEGIYSLVGEQGGSADSCGRAAANMARKIVRRAFTPNPDHSIKLTDEMIRSLNVSREISECLSHVDYSPYDFIKISYGGLFSAHQIYGFVRPLKDIWVEVSREVSRMCKETARSLSIPHRIFLSAERRPYSIERRGDALHFSPRSMFLVDQSVKWKGILACEMDLKRILIPWFTYSSSSSFSGTFPNLRCRRGRDLPVQDFNP